jgi:phage terminase large subunit
VVHPGGRPRGAAGRLLRGGNEAGFDHYARILDEKAREHGWRYGDHWFPHDTAHHELSTGVSRADTLRTLGIDPTVVPVSHVMDGVNGVRRLLSRSWIDEQRCERGLAALQNYRREWDDERKVLKAKPVHDWSSHGADALRTFAEGFGDTTGPLPGRRYYQAQPVSRTTSWAA